MSAAAGAPEEIKVSVYCLAYNHEKYIRDALEGFVSQKTDFRYEVIVHDDASEDGTAEIIREYARRYPEIIRPVFQTENQWSKGVRIVPVHIWPRIRGKYIAVCEGDDYWTDYNKLQKQYDYMEAHPNCALCFTNAVMQDRAGGGERTFIPYSASDRRHFVSGKEDYNLHDFWRLGFVPMASYFFKKSSYGELMDSGIPDCPCGDLRIRLFMASQGYAHFMNESTCVYRENVPGSVMTRWKKQDGRKMFEDSRRNFRMLSVLDEYTGHVYHRGLLPFMVLQGAPMLENSTLKRIFRDPGCRMIFRAMRPSQKLKTLVKSFTGGKEHLMN